MSTSGTGTAGRGGRFASALAGLLAGLPLLVHAGALPVDKSQIDALVEESRFAEVARLVDKVLAGIPENLGNRGERNYLASTAVNSYALAFDASPQDCDLATSGVALADRYLAGLIAAYGDDVKGSDEYAGISGRRDELGQERLERGCPVVSSPPPDLRHSGPPAGAQALRTDPSDAEDLEEVNSPAVNSPAVNSPTELDSSDSLDPQRRRYLVVGLAATAATTGALVAASLGTGLSRYKEPFRGAGYERIYDAARSSFTDGVAGNEVEYGANSDMCGAAGRSRNAEVDSACAGWERLGKAAVATGIGAGVMGAATIALAVFLARRDLAERRQTSVSRHRFAIGVAPTRRRGASVAVSLRF